MPLCHYVNCPNEDCDLHQKPILLPPSSPPRPDDDLEGWPTDETHLYVACPSCRLVSVHCSAHVDDFLPESQSEFRKDRVWLRIRFVCGVEDCKTLSEFHALMARALQQKLWREIYEKFQIGYWKGATVCHHPIQPPRDELLYFDEIQGKLKGHDPRHDPDISLSRP